MTAPPRTDPVPAPVAGAGSRRPRVVTTLAVGVVLAALVRGFVLESYYVPSDANAPTAEPGDRVLVLKTDRRPDAGVALVEGPDGAARLVPADTLREDAVGSVLWRFWPLDRFGPVSSGGAAS